MHPETLRSLSYAKGTYNTVTIYNSKDCKTIQPKDIEAGSKNGVFTFYLSFEPGDYTVLLKSQNSEYTYYYTTIPACTHSFGEYVYNNDANCTSNGTKSAVCKICGVTDTVEIAGSALGHSFENYVYNNDATCQKTGTETAQCSRCSVTDMRMLEYNPAHKFNDYVYNDDATCLKNGTKTGKCIYCDMTYTVEASGTKLDHDYGEYTYNKDATCLADGTKSAFCRLVVQKEK